MILAFTVTVLCTAAFILWLVLWTLSAATKRKVIAYCNHYDGLDKVKLRRDIRNYPFFRAEKRFLSMRTFLNWGYGVGGFLYLILLVIHARKALILYQAGNVEQVFSDAVQLFYYLLIIAVIITKYLFVKREVDEFDIWLKT